MLTDDFQFPAMVVLVGIPASGKSTLAVRLLPDFVRINLDTLRTRRKEQLALNEALAQGRSVVVDNTNVLRAERARYIEMGRAAGYHVYGVFLQSRVADCIGRNALREGRARLPEKAVVAMSNRMELPVPEEGFDRLYFAAISDGEYIINQWKTADEL